MRCALEERKIPAMNRFEYRRAENPQEAALALAEAVGSKIIGGGTDLLPLMKEEIVSPVTLIDLSRWRDGGKIEETDDGLLIGSTATLAAIAAHPIVMEYYTALANACGLAAAPQLRNMGTIGGNLLQQTRCWYYRGAFECWMKGGEKCYARGGENAQHAIFHTDFNSSQPVSVCVTAHPSDPAAALLALDASVEYLTSTGAGSMPISELYALPTAERRAFNTLPEGGVITGLRLPLQGDESRSIYRKAMARATWAFALAGVALSFRLNGDKISGARVALSGVAPIPIRIEGVERYLEGKKLEDAEPHEMARHLIANAAPLAHNGYKVDLLQGLFKQTWMELAEE